ncbi:MAG: Imidazoleglycerol-phosphate dehydratase [Syntrophaceae bacterium PtaU1.Bin231]|nr:MAG: Imidazoleglycerol-phosphate dehydratase [Syntrophaceae bacterium PtaU1.Bin231]HOG17444.1 imidazoleglycerol-phosphate dehydratase HisB [Syntrophales bacterium]
MARQARIHRVTRETDISVLLKLDGKGEARIATTIPFFDHMLELLAHHGRFDLTVEASGDTHVDDHHLVEDLGICLGDAVRKALGDKKGIGRYGNATVPMDESLCSVALDISGRPCLVYHVDIGRRRIGRFDPALLGEFFKAFADHGGITLHINLAYGKNNHHIAEAAFKAFARALDEATALSNRIQGILSTKGTL